jgi:hypothetical protein
MTEPFKSILISKLNLSDSPEATISRTVENLKTNQWYEFYIRAHNAAGWGPATAIVTHLTLSDVTPYDSGSPSLFTLSNSFILQNFISSRVDTGYYNLYINTSNDPGTSYLFTTVCHPTNYITIQLGQKSVGEYITITSGVTYWFWLTEVDTSGNESVNKTASDPASGHIAGITQIILEDPTLLSDHQWQGMAMTGAAGENLSLGNSVYKKLNSGVWKYYKYDANGTDKLILPGGIATADITSGYSGTILENGIMRDDTWALSPSSDAAVTVYSSATPGGLSLSPPGTAGDEVVVAGYLVAANTIRIKFGYAWVEI